jgi:peptidoglycan hydrolase CwlO-like protein
MQKQRRDLEVTMNQLKTDRENDIKAITAKLETQQKEIERRQREYAALENSRRDDKKKHEKMLQAKWDEMSRMKEELQEARESAERKKPGECPNHSSRRN